MNNAELGRALRRARSRAGLTQDELAELSDVKRTTIDALENGRIKESSVETINKLQAALPISMREVLAAMGYNVDPADEEVRRLFEDRDEVAEFLMDAVRRLYRHGSPPS